MCAQHTDVKPNALLSILGNKCPRCRRGKLFQTDNAYNLKKFMKMHDNCPVCGQPVELEVGFYYGTGYVSYALSIAFCVATFIAWWVLIGFSFSDNRFMRWVIANAVVLIALQPVLMRMSRTVWLWFFVKYSSNWDKGDIVIPERQNERMKNAW